MIKLTPKIKYTLSIVAIFLFGIIIGGYLFHNTQSRSIINLHNCQKTCYKPKDLLGLFASVGIQSAPSLMPNVVAQTNKTIVIKHPYPEAKIHYIAIPKKDIKNVGEINTSDAEYIIDAYLVMSEIIRKENLTNYRVITNGPGYQTLTYLHFHLIAN